MSLSGFASRLKWRREREGFWGGAALVLLLFTAVAAGVLGLSGPAQAIDDIKIGPDAVNAFGDYSQYHFYMYSSYDVVAADADEKFGGLTSDNTCKFDISRNIVTGQLNEDANYAGIIYDQPGFSGSLTKVGTGEFILSGVNTYKGGTYINGGAIGVYNDYNLGAASGGLSFDGGTLRCFGTFSSARSITLNDGGGTVDTTIGFKPTLSGVIGGTGSLTKTGLGTLTLTGHNTYTGDTIIDGGTLSLGADYVLSDQTDVIIDPSGTLYCADGTVNSIGSLSGSGDIVLGVASFLYTGYNNTDTVFSGSISGGGFLQQYGSGTLHLTGTGSAAGIFIQQGRVIVDGDFQFTGLDVSMGCVLGGTGTVYTINNSGTVTPGDAGIGTLTVYNYYHQFSNGTYEAEVDPSGACDLLNISGVANLDGTLSIVAAPGTYGSLTNYTLLTAGGGVNGAFSNVITDLPSYLGYNVTYDANDVYLEIMWLSLGSTRGFTYNQNSVADTLDRETANATGGMLDLLNAVYSLPSSEQPAALDSLTGEVHTAAAQSSVDFMASFMNTVDARLAQARGGMLASKDAPAYVMLASADEGMTDTGSMYAAGPAGGSRIGLWLKGNGVFGETDPDGNAHGYDYNVGGTSAGLEFDNGLGLVLGLGGGYGVTNLDMDEELGSGDAGSTQVGAYAGYKAGPAYVDGAAYYAYNRYDTKRNIPVAGGTARASYSGNEYSVMAETGYGLGVAGLEITPLASFQWTRLDTEGFTESGAGAADLAVAKRSTDSLLPGAGVKVSMDFVTSGWNVLPEIRGRWTHECANNDQTISASFAGGTGGTFPVHGLDIGRDKALVGAGISVFSDDGISLAVDYDAQLNGEMTAHAVTGQMKYMW